MAQLFAGEMFDRFHVNKCEVTTFTTFVTDGRCHPAWFDTDEKPSDGSGLVTWSMLKPVIYSLIRGKKTPKRLLLDLCHPMTNGDVGSLRIQYEKEELLLFTGYMQKEFSMRKEKQQQWDDNCEEFIKKNDIASTHLE